MARILVVEANEEVRALIVDVLTADGHEVDCFGSGTEALARLDGSRFDLVLSDLTIPAVAGIGLYWEIASRWPHLVSRLIYVTGTVDSGSTDYQILLTDGVPVVLKPFPPRLLLEVVARTLARSSGS